MSKLTEVSFLCLNFGVEKSNNENAAEGLTHSCIVDAKDRGAKDEIRTLAYCRNLRTYTVQKIGLHRGRAACFVICHISDILS
jgi:hypothetical protein